MHSAPLPCKSACELVFLSQTFTRVSNEVLLSRLPAVLSIVPFRVSQLLARHCHGDGVLDARIASALNKIIHNSHFKRRLSLEEQKTQKQDRFLRGRPIAYLIYEQFRVTGTDSSVENYTDLFTIVLRNDDSQEFESKWDGIFSMTKIPHDDILEGLYKLRIRESEKLKTVLELYDLETHQKK